MSYPNFGHNRYGDCFYDFFDHFRVTLYKKRKKEAQRLVMNCEQSPVSSMLRGAQKINMNAQTILATPPCALISAGTLSSAITAQAPASSAIRAYENGSNEEKKMEDENENEPQVRKTFLCRTAAKWTN